MKETLPDFISLDLVMPKKSGIKFLYELRHNKEWVNIPVGLVTAHAHDKLKHLKTLLVDDDEFVRDSFRLMFESKDCFLLGVETAEEAIEVLRWQSYDIIITDYKLPGMNGLEFCRQIQKTHPRAKTILITAYGSQTLRDDASEIGVNELIEKPITPLAVEASLARLFDGTA